MAGTDASGEGLFREEAIRHHAAIREHGELLKPPPRWTRWAFPLLAVAAVAAVAVLFTSERARFVEGPAVLRVAGWPERSEGTVLAVLPASARSGIAPGSVLRVVVPGFEGRGIEATVFRVFDGVEGDAAGRISDAPWLSLGDGSMLVEARVATGSVPSGLDRSASGLPIPVRVEATAGTDRLLFVLLPGLRAAVAD